MDEVLLLNNSLMYLFFKLLLYRLNIFILCFKYFRITLHTQRVKNFLEKEKIIEKG